MNYKVEFNEEAQIQFNKLDNSIKIRILKFFKKLENVDNPKAFGKPLSGNLKNLWRYRVDNFRFIAKIQDNELIILVIEIDKRAEIYK